MNEQIEKRIIPTELLQTVVNFLATRPFAEVHTFLPALLALPIAPAAEPEAEVLKAA